MRVLQIAALLIAGAIASTCPLTAVHADSWPGRPIRWIVPYPAGGGTDLVSRALGAKLSEYLGQTVIVDNRSGGNTIIGTSALAQAQPDGYTVGLVADPHAINVAGGKTLPYDSERDFVPIVHLLWVPFVLIANSTQVPMRTLPDLVNYANAHPGWLSFGSLGPGSPHEIAMMWFKDRAKLDVLIVPYRGIGPALQDTVAGHVKTMLLGVSVADELIRAGKVHPIATTSPTRLKSAPDVPTIAEQGYSDYAFVTWYGLMAPRNTPPEIVQRLNTEINRALNDPEVQAKIGSAGGEIVGGTPQQLSDLIRRDTAKYRKIFEQTGIKID